MRIAENMVLGLDLGIGSIGWALIEEDPETLEKRILCKELPGGEMLYALGSRCINVPENKRHELLNVARRQKRSSRRVVARKAQRIKGIRTLLAEAGVPEIKDLDGVHHVKGRPQASPWQLRHKGLKEKLSDLEFAIVLIHIAKHRGFRSNSKSEAAQKDAGKVKQALIMLEAKLQKSGAETIGQLMAMQPTTRNRTNAKGEAQYDNVMMRSWQEAEVRLLFERQRSFGNALAASGIDERYHSLAFDQRELKSVAGMVGNCVFIENEKRAPAFAPTAELFRRVFT